MKNSITISVENADQVLEWLEDLISTAERTRTLIKKMPALNIITSPGKDDPQ